MKFLGYKREDGRVGTRNYYLVIPTSMCVSEIALTVTSDYDEVVSIPNTEGCGCASTGQIDRFLTVLGGYINHPNVGGCLVIDLGCEQTNYDVVNKYLEKYNLTKPIDWITVQDSGGTRLSIEQSKEIVSKRLVEINTERTPEDLSNIILGTECGASDINSGVTANPLIGSVADKIVGSGGKVILSEVPEMVGIFNLLSFRNKEVELKFKNIYNWYENLANKLDLDFGDNLVKKNIEGGLADNYIKSLGAIKKGGTTIIEDVIEYGEYAEKCGLNIMQGPGSDIESVTGIVSSGANIVCFSTGFGTPTGNAICPVVKISSNSIIANNLPEDIDFDAGKSLSSEELLEKVVSVASGEKTWSEKWKQRQFQVWTAGKLSL